MKLEIMIPTTIEFSHRKYEYKKGDFLEACGKECKKNHIETPTTVLEQPRCKLYNQPLYWTKYDQEYLGFFVRCDKCLATWKDYSLAEKTVMDEHTFTMYLLNRLRKVSRIRLETVESIAKKMVEKDGKVNYRRRKSFIEKYGIDLEQVWNDYFESRKVCY